MQHRPAATHKFEGRAGLSSGSGPADHQPAARVASSGASGASGATLDLDRDVGAEGGAGGLEPLVQPGRVCPCG